MKKNILPLFIIGFLLLFTITTNPSSKVDYVNWVKEQINEESGMFFGWIGGTIVHASTNKKNLLLFTIYETKISDKEEERLVALGLFNKFIWLKGFPESSPEK